MVIEYISQRRRNLSANRVESLKKYERFRSLCDLVRIQAPYRYGEENSQTIYHLDIFHSDQRTHSILLLKIGQSRWQKIIVTSSLSTIFFYYR